jgi:trans-aconitate 2-methyltransferase
VSWDAATYERVADPQEAWAREVLDRSGISGADTVLDAGCGGGRITALLLERAGRVIAVDADPEMVATARAALPGDVEVRRQDLLELTVDEPVDVVFSNAVFHWIGDHDRLFARIHAALRPGGRLVAQCGGAGNIAAVLRVVGERPGTWRYAGAEETEERLRAAGFTHARAWLEPKPTEVPDMTTYLETVVLHGVPGARAIAERAAPQLDELDYVRLNIEATR